MEKEEAQQGVELLLSGGHTRENASTVGQGKFASFTGYQCCDT